MTLRHDKDGFLQGEPVEIGSGNFARALEIMHDIRSDTAAIRSALGKSVREATKPAGRTQSMPVAVPRRTSGVEIANITRLAAAISPNAGNKSAGKTAVPNINRTRDDKGRFAHLERSQVPRPSSAKSAASEHDWRVKFSGSEAGAKSQGAFTRSVQMLGGAASKLSNVANNTQQIDPAIAAANEIKGVISPVVGAFRRDKSAEETKKTVPWFRRIWGELRALNKKPSGGGAGAGIADLLGGGASGKMLRAGAGLLRFLGPVAAVAGSAFAGWKLGGFINDKVINPGMERLTGKKGESIGSWAHDALHVNDINDKDFGRNIFAVKVEKTFDQMLAGWNTLTDFIKDKWQGSFLQKGVAETKQVVNTTKDFAVQAGNKANDVIKTATGVDVKGAVGKTLEGAKNLVGSVIESGKGYNVVQRPDGSVEKQEGARNWRNNNPGNIEYGDFAKKQGAIASDGRFAIFPSYEAGRKAKESLIFEGNGGKKLATVGDYGAGLAYKDKTLAQAIAAYAPSEENNTAAYQKAVLDSVGGVNKRMGDYTPEERQRIMNAMERVEGYKPGKVTQIQPPSAVPAVAEPKPISVPASPKKSLYVDPVTGEISEVSPQIPAAVATGAVRAVTAMPASVALPSAAPNISKLTPPPTPEPPPTQIGSSAAGDKSVTVNMPREVGQNVSDRGIAQVVTGGIGAKS